MIRETGVKHRSGNKCVQGQMYSMKPGNRPFIELRLQDTEVYQGLLVLVNRDHPVRHQEQQTEKLPGYILRSMHAEEPDISLERTCLHQLAALIDACEATDKITVVSGYRSSRKQRQIYESTLASHGEAFTASYVALPGASEHQTGLAVDVGLLDRELDYIRPSFSGEGASGVFRDLAPVYGFIQRYQEGKEEVTGIACEPWHYRYVGYPHAAIMEQRGLCLEEYTGYVKDFPWGIRHLCYEDGERVYEIYYVKATGEETDVPIVTGGSAEWSGNNQDGYIITVSRTDRNQEQA